MWLQDITNLFVHIRHIRHKLCECFIHNTPLQVCYNRIDVFGKNRHCFGDNEKRIYHLIMQRVSHHFSISAPEIEHNYEVGDKHCEDERALAFNTHKIITSILSVLLFTTTTTEWTLTTPFAYGRIIILIKIIL